MVFAMIEGPVLGWTNPVLLGIAAMAAMALIGFLRYETRRTDPFIDLRYFRSEPFASATATAVCAFAAWAAFLFMMSLYLQGERGYSAMATGLIYLPIAIGALVFSPLSGRLVGRFGSRPSLLIAGVMITAAAGMLMFLTPTTPVWALLAIFGAYGIGFAMINAPVTNAAVSGMPRDRAGGGFGHHLDQPAGRCEYRRGAVRFGGRLGPGRYQCGIHRRGQAAVDDQHRPGSGDYGVGYDVDIVAGQTIRAATDKF